MPAIRNFTHSFTSTVGTTIQAFMPATQPGDLILGICNARTLVQPINFANTVATFTGSISGNTLTVWIWSTPTYANISPGLTITGTGISANTVITGQTDAFTAGPNLLTATPTRSSGGLVNGNTVVVSSATGISVGQLITGTGVPDSAYVVNVSSTTVTISHNFTANATGTYNFYTAGYLGRYTLNTTYTTVANATITATWTTLHQANNIAIGSAIVYKFATANEPDPVFALSWQNNGASYLGGNTAQIHTISIRDVERSAPFNGNSLQSQPGYHNGIRQPRGVATATGNATVTGTVQATWGIINTNNTTNVALYNNTAAGYWSIGSAITTTSAQTVLANITAQNTSFFAANAGIGVVAGGASGTNSFVANTVTNVFPGNLIIGTNLPVNTYVTAVQGSNVFLSNTFTGAASGAYGIFMAGGPGHYTVTANPGNLGNLLTNVRATTFFVSNVISGKISANMQLFGGFTAITSVANLSSGTGSYGTYTANVNAAVASQTITGNLNFRDLMPTITTSVNDSLIIYAQASPTAAPTVPMILEGPTVYEDGADAILQSQGWSWSMQRTAGTTSRSVYWNRLDPLGGTILHTIAVSPPAGGAGVIPTYCSADSSFWFDPINGVTSYNYNNALTADATVWFGSAINNRTVANAAASAGNIDVGVNPYHSMGTLAPATVVSGSWFGSQLTINTKNRTNISGKNILVHLRPTIPKTIQTTDDISRTGTKGFAVGLASGGSTPAAVTSKVYHVHGAGTLWNSSTYVPVVVNDTATKGLIQSNGSYSGTTFSRVGFFTSGFQINPLWNIGSLWQLDTTVVSGGDVNNPMTLQGIVKAASTGKERISVLQQGALQALVLQPLQFGDGGTNPMYLNLSDTVIEFPKQYDLESKQVFYCSADNIAGITYFAGASDTIVQVDSVINSQSRYYWGLHPSSSASARYDFTGTTIIGAGQINLNTNINLSGLKFSRCVEITAPFPATLANCQFDNTTSTSGSGALVISGGTEAILQNQLNTLSNCTFSNNTVSSGGLRILWTGPVTAAGITLTTSSLFFNNNTYDIYWDSPANPTPTPLYFRLRGTAFASSANYDGTDRVFISLLRNLTINNIIDGTKIRIYRTGIGAGGNVLLANADSIGTNPSGLSSITQALDSIYPGRYAATYEYPYTVARAGTANIASTSLVVSQITSGTIYPGQIITGTGVPVAQSITINTPNGISGNGTQVTAFYSSQSTIPFIAGQRITVSNVSVAGYNGTDLLVTTANATSVSFVSAQSGGSPTLGNITSVATFISGQTSGVGGSTGLEGTYTLNQPVRVADNTSINFDTPIYIVAYALGYQALRPTTSLVLNGQSISIEQQIDRQYNNPNGIGV